jgi:hypothetical protein
MASQQVGERLRRKEPEACLPEVTNIRILTSNSISSSVWRGRMCSHQKQQRRCHVYCVRTQNPSLVVLHSSSAFFFFTLLLLLLLLGVVVVSPSASYR